MSVAVQVRYFAAAAEAAGRESEQVTAATTRQLRESMVDRHGAQLERVLSACSLLVDGVVAGAETPLPAGAVVDVLPPFAGG